MSGFVYSSGAYYILFPRGKGPKKYQNLTILYLPTFPKMSRKLKKYILLENNLMHNLITASW